MKGKSMREVTNTILGAGWRWFRKSDGLVECSRACSNHRDKSTVTVTVKSINCERSVFLWDVTQRRVGILYQRC